MWAAISSALMEVTGKVVRVNAKTNKITKIENDFFREQNEIKNKQ